LLGKSKIPFSPVILLCRTLHPIGIGSQHFV